jgi:catechol 2,3-dioxygenase-like lactoylglutathione lyase family enzyme
MTPRSVRRRSDNIVQPFNREPELHRHLTKVIRLSRRHAFILPPIRKQRKTTMASPNLIILYVKDPAESVPFYRDLLGREAAVASPNFAAFPLDGGFTLGLWRRSDVEPQPSATGSRGEIAFMVPGEGAVAAHYEDWRRRGLPIAQDLTTMDFGPTFVVLDPDGHRLRVCEPDK